MDETRYFLKSLRRNDLSGVAVSTIEVLFGLIELGESSSAALADKLGITQQQALDGLETLQAKGLVEIAIINKPGGKKGRFPVYIYKPAMKAGEALGL